MGLYIPKALTDITAVISTVDCFRRSLAPGCLPLAEVYVEAARGNLHHAREAILRYGRSNGGTVTRTISAGARLEIVAGQLLCDFNKPGGWIDEKHPTQPDLGADLMASDDARLASATWHSGGMLLAALADHAWLDVSTGTSWSTDRAGARALIGAMNNGRPVAHYDVRMLCGTLDLETVRLISAVGWRRLRSPEWLAK